MFLSFVFWLGCRDSEPLPESQTIQASELKLTKHFKQKRNRPHKVVCSFFGWGAGIRTPEMSESESDALPLGDTPIFSTDDIISHRTCFVNTYFKLFWKNYSTFLLFSKNSPFFTLQNMFFVIQYISQSYIYPWHSWIARQTPTLKANGSNPFG